MIKVTVDDQAIRRLMQEMPKTAGRAAERAIDRTATEIRDAVKREIPRVFDNPVPYTRNSLRLTRTRNHNMQASVWFKDPDRMEDHYLVPQVEGTTRKTKGFERALDKIKMVPGRGARMTAAGNVSVGQIRQVLSVLKRSQRTLGYQSNITKRSATRNRNQRDYVYLPRGSGKLPPGVYERVAQQSRLIDASTKRKFKMSGAKAYQFGKSKGKWQRITRARGLQGILIRGRQQHRYRAQLDFYGIAERIHNRTFRSAFEQELRKELAL